MSGYSAIGKKPAAIAPSKTMTIEITQARTGRSMKKRANMVLCPFEGRRSGIRSEGSAPGVRGQESGVRSQESDATRVSSADFCLLPPDPGLQPPPFGWPFLAADVWLLTLACPQA